MSRPEETPRPQILRSRLPSWANAALQRGQTRRQPSRIPPPTQATMGAAPSQPQEQEPSSLSRTTPFTDSYSPSPSLPQEPDKAEEKQPAPPERVLEREKLSPENGERKENHPPESVISEGGESVLPQNLVAPQEDRGGDEEDKKATPDRSSSPEDGGSRLQQNIEAKEEDEEDQKKKKKKAMPTSSPIPEAKEEDEEDQKNKKKAMPESSPIPEAKEEDEEDQKKKKKAMPAGSPIPEAKEEEEQEEDEKEASARRERKFPPSSDGQITSSRERTGIEKEGSSKMTISTVSRGSVSADQQSSSLQKEIREGISRLVQSLAVKNSKHGDGDGGGQGITMITLAGDNHGATMNVGYSSSGKEEASKKTTSIGERSSGMREKVDEKEDRSTPATATSVNSNVQTINGSILHDSCFSDEHPGVHLVVSNGSRPESAEETEARKLGSPLMAGKEPRVRRRCLRALLMEPSDEDQENPRRRHGCRYVCNEGKKSSGERGGQGQGNGSMPST